MRRYFAWRDILTRCPAGLMTISEAARILGVHKTTVNYWLRQSPARLEPIYLAGFEEEDPKVSTKAVLDLFAASRTIDHLNIEGKTQLDRQIRKSGSANVL